MKVPQITPTGATGIMLVIVVIITSVSLAIVSIQNLDIRNLVEQVNQTATDTHIIADRLANTEIGVLINRTHFLEVLENHTSQEILDRLDQIAEALNITTTVTVN